ncbi:MAG: multicopper oxidase domain-containing protein, partial [Casimicrobiaceae bacterium]
MSIWHGSATDVLRYTAQVVSGRADALRPSAGYLGPTLEFRRGERVRIEFVNRIDESSIVHWHGMIVPAKDDGHPRFAIAPGRSYVYDFTVRNPAGTYLYHPHPHGRTGRQVYSGLAGLLIVRDDEEQAVGLPSREHELSLVIQDRRVGQDNRLVFKRSMMDTMTGVLGDTVLVNGVADAAFNVAPRTYRLRLANVSNARIYKLAWSDGHPMHAIARDNGLFSRAEGIQTRPYVVLGPFQRVELLEDFGARYSSRKVVLVSKRFDDPGGMAGMMRGMMGGGMMGGSMMGRGMMGDAQGKELSVASFTVAAGSPTKSDPP